MFPIDLSKKNREAVNLNSVEWLVDTIFLLSQSENNLFQQSGFYQVFYVFPYSLFRFTEGRLKVVKTIDFF